MSTSSTASKYWIAVASAEHVRRGRSEGFMQVNHGKAASPKRVKPRDRVVYYSPALAPGGKDKLQCFTAIGTVKSGAPYLFGTGGGFKPYRRDVAWTKADETLFVRCSTTGVPGGEAEPGPPVTFRSFPDWRRRRHSLGRSRDESGDLVVRALL